MLTPACIRVVKQEIEKIGLVCKSVELGKVEIVATPTIEQLELLKQNLSECNLELLENKRNILTERIKIEIVDVVYYSQPLLKVNFSCYLSGRLGLDYTYMANVFSETEGITIEQYFIKQRIERVKQLIKYGEMSLTEISWKLNYSSVSHLSTQFKRCTGVTPTHYKQITHPEEDTKTCEL